MIRHTRVLATQQVAAKADIAALFADMTNQLRGVLLQAAEPEGTIPLEQLRGVRTRIAPLVMRFFVGVDGRNAYTPGHEPLSPFARTLNRHIARVQAEVVQAHTRWLRRRVPLDVLTWLANPRPLQEQVEVLRRSNPLAQYEHSHEWADSRGYTLSDRIWQTGVETRRKIDLLMAEGIRNGDSAVRIAGRLEAFLNPSRRNVRTQKPYGRDGSFDAMRLARSEITLAHSRASKIAATTNPFVEGMNFVLSPSHPRVDICDPLAAGSPYPVEEVPVPVLDTHPHCLCTLTPNTGDIQATVEDIRSMMERGDRPAMNPANPGAFLLALLGSTLFALVSDEVQGTLG